MFFAANRSKRSLALDFKDVRGREALLRLVDRADVFVQSMRAGAAERHGLGGEDAARAQPALVYCSIGAFGPDGPLAGEPGYDPLMQAFAGLMSITGEPDRPGVRVGASLIDIGTGVWAALGIVAALLERAQTGRGREVERRALRHRRSRSSATSSPPRSQSGVAPGRHGTAFPLIAPYEVFATADGELMIAAANDRLFRSSSAGASGLPELADDPRFRTNPDRLAHRDELLPPIRERLASEAPSALARRRSRASRVAPVQDLVAGRRAPADARGRDAAGRRRARAVAAPLQIDGERLEHARAAAAPRRALDRRARGARLLTDDEIAALRARRRSRVGRVIARPQKIVCVGLNYRDHAEEQGVDAAGAAAALREVAEHADRRGRPDPHPADLAEGRLRGRARRRDRPPRRAASSVDDALDFVEGYVVAQRRLRARPPVRRRPVGARQVARHVPARRRPRAGRRGPRPAGAPDPRDPERRGDAGLEHVEHDLRRRRDHRVRLAGDHARAGRPDHHRDARRRRRVPRSAASGCSRATRSRSRSTASARSRTPSSPASVHRRRALLAALFLAALALRPQLVGIGPLIPAIQDDLDVSHAVAGLLGTIPVLCMGLFAPPAPFLSRRLGSRLAIAAALR